MKKIIFITLISFITLSTFAQWGTMTISSQNFNQRFWLFVDDILQNQYSVSSIQVNGMNIQQQYKVRVEMDNAEQNVLGQNIYITPNPRNNNFFIQNRNGDFTFKKSNFNGNPNVVIFLIVPNYSYYNDYYSYLYPGFGNYGNYWGNSGRQYNFSNIPDDCHPNNNGNYSGNGNYPGNGNYGNNQGNGNYGNHQGNGNNNNHQGNNNHGNNNQGNNNHGNNNQGNNNGQHNGNGPCMNQNEFNTALNSIRSDSFESGKLSKAKQIVSRNRMCTAQIIQIVRLFSFESNKLEFAKYAYQYCTDKNNYYQVTDAFSFQSSKDELLKFIR